MKYILSIVVSLFIFSAALAKDDVFEVQVKIVDHVFHPSVVDVPSGHKIKLVIYNDDDSVEEFESHDLHREKIIAPHSHIIVTIAPLSPGEYKFFGEFHEDTAQGILNVK
ncbi:MAG: cupredoxin domain-containing protein [Rickettsiaceae bacterium]|nr:cupredoxin domain-containing protein [Rickettsiaceae bacterium]